MKEISSSAPQANTKTTQKATRVVLGPLWNGPHVHKWRLTRMFLSVRFRYSSGDGSVSNAGPESRSASGLQGRLGDQLITIGSHLIHISSALFDLMQVVLNNTTCAGVQAEDNYTNFATSYLMGVAANLLRFSQLHMNQCSVQADTISSQDLLNRRPSSHRNANHVNVDVT